MNDIFALEQLSVTVKTGHLWQRREKTILQGISFSLAEGESVAYLGPNGAGKTTTFRAICGLATRIEGQFFWWGEKKTPAQLHRKIGFLPEASYFYRTLTPRELLTGLGRLSGLTDKEVKKKVHYWAEQLDFTGVLEQSIRTCSKGQLQRVGLAQALLHEPELLILDEPMSGLDPIGRDVVRRTLQAVNANGTTLLFSSHILADAEILCHKVVALHQGRLIYDGGLEGLLGSSGAWFIRMACEYGLPTGLDGLHCRSEADGSFTITGDGGQDVFDSTIRQLMSMDGVHVLESGMRKPRLEEAFVDLIKADGKEV